MNDLNNGKGVYRTALVTTGLLNIWVNFKANIVLVFLFSVELQFLSTRQKKYKHFLNFYRGYMLVLKTSNKLDTVAPLITDAPGYLNFF